MRTGFLLLSFAVPIIGTAQLNGTYVIDPAGTGDYTTLALAEQDLFALGVDGPTTFAFVDGVHNGNVTIRSYPGASPANRVTITSLSGNAAAATVHASGLTQVHQSCLTIIAYPGHLSITDLTITSDEMAVNVEHSKDVRVERCTLIGSGADLREIAIKCHATDNGSFIGNTIIGFRSGIIFHGDPGAYAIGAEMLDNTVTSGAEHAEGIAALFAEEVTIAGNHVETVAPVPASLYYSQGITVLDVNGPVVVARNTIIHGTGGVALMVNDVSGSATEPTRVENNMILMTQAHGSGQSAAGFFDLEQLEVVHNTIRAEVAGSAAVHFSGLADARVRANIFSSTHAHAAKYSTPTFTDVLFKRNLFHAASALPIYMFDTALVQFVPMALAQWQTLGWDEGSITGDPHFVSSTDLHITALSAAVGLARSPGLVAEDIDGEPRPGPLFPMVEAGADELDVCGLFRGIYVIGTSTDAHYATFNEARSALYSCGVGGPVVFEVEPGTYTETLLWDIPIAGASTLNTITFRGQSMDSTQVTLTWPSAVNIRLIAFKDADHVFFEHMTFTRSAANGSELVRVDNSGAAVTFNCGFRNCRFVGNSVANANNIMVRSITGDAQGAMYFERCAFTDGHEAIKWIGAAYECLRIADCTFEDWSLDAVQVTSMGTGLEIAGNRFTHLGAHPGTALKIFSGNGAFRVERNHFLLSGNGTGSGTILLLDDCVSPMGAKGLVANNMLIAWDRESVKGMHITNECTRIDIQNNSVSLKNGWHTGAALVIATSASGLECGISNNIFHSRTSYSVHNPAAIALGTYKRNLLHTTYANLADWGGAQVDLPALQAASEQFNNSIQAPPLFVSNSSDLHLQPASPAVAAGFAHGGVVEDFDQQPRPLPAATNPDIGADEIDQSAPFALRAFVTDTGAGTQAFRLVPNPATEQVRWSNLPIGAERIQLYDATGRSIREVGATEPSVNVNDLPAGTYHALVIGAGAVLASVRLVVIH